MLIAKEDLNGSKTFTAKKFEELNESSWQIVFYLKCTMGFNSWEKGPEWLQGVSLNNCEAKNSRHFYLSIFNRQMYEKMHGNLKSEC